MAARVCGPSSMLTSKGSTEHLKTVLMVATPQALRRLARWLREGSRLGRIREELDQPEESHHEPFTSQPIGSPLKAVRPLGGSAQGPRQLAGQELILRSGRQIKLKTGLVSGRRADATALATPRWNLKRLSSSPLQTKFR